MGKNLKYLLLGTIFGLVLTKAEAISWFRMQEMFRFQSFHMYGLMASAIFVGVLSMQLLLRLGARTLDGQPIVVPTKKFNHGTWLGGLIFGVGWAITGACPGPIFAQIGSGSLGGIVLLLAALAGTWTYSALRDKLPL
jgi:uncharacterized membrane protein YedE/YeeE